INDILKIQEIINNDLETINFDFERGKLKKLLAKYRKTELILTSSYSMIRIVLFRDKWGKYLLPASAVLCAIGLIVGLKYGTGQNIDIAESKEPVDDDKSQELVIDDISESSEDKEDTIETQITYEQADSNCILFQNMPTEFDTVSKPYILGNYEVRNASKNGLQYLLDASDNHVLVGNYVSWGPITYIDGKDVYVFLAIDGCDYTLDAENLHDIIKVERAYSESEVRKRWLISEDALTDNSINTPIEDTVSTQFGDPDPFEYIDSPRIKAELEKMDKGEAFQFPYVMGQCENGIGSHYSLIGPLFKQLEIDGIKYLVDANDESKVFVSGYDWLGYPYYLFGYDKENGGMDPESKFSGWVIPTYKYVNIEEPGVYDLYPGGTPSYTFNLYDFETFKPLIIEAEPDEEFMSYGTDFFGTHGPIVSTYVKEYDLKDKFNSSAGYVIEVEKWNTNYLVDVNDFKTVVASSYSRFDNLYDEGFTITYTSETGETIPLSVKDINPIKSDILIRERKK
ncbi:MAG: hypothetical protein K2J20_01660, partial [Bacilli bacterium]|nr:hypothetical protein [Bacilli bacterium]